MPEPGLPLTCVSMAVPNQYSTVEDHMPPDHQAYLQWNGERFIRWARAKSASTPLPWYGFSLSAHKVEQQGYKSCMALLKLADPLFRSTAGERLARKVLSLHRIPQPQKRPVHPEIRAGQAAR